MIHFKRFRIENAICFGCLTLNLEKQGLTLITGANACGKSSSWNLLQSLFYGGYSISSKSKAKKNDLLSTSGKDLLLECEFEKDNVNYIVRQTRNHKEYGTSIAIFKNGDLSLNHAKHSFEDAQTDLENILGLTLDEFLGYIYLTQGSSHKLIEGTSGERTKYLSSLRQLDLYDDVCKVLKDNLKELEIKAISIDKYVESLNTLENQLKGYSSAQIYLDKKIMMGMSLDRVKEESSSLGNRLEFAAKMKSDVCQRIKLIDKVGNIEKEGLDNKIKELQDKINNSEIARSEHTLNINKWESLLKYKKEYDSLFQTCTHKNTDILTGKIKDLEENQTELKTIIPQLEKKEAYSKELIGYSKPKESMTVCTTQYEIASASLIDAKSTINRLSKTLKGFKGLGQGDCPTCGQPLTKEHLQGEIVRLELEINEAEKASDVLNFDKTRYGNLVKTWGEIETLESKINEIKVIGSLEQSKEDLLFVDKKVKQLKDTLTNVQKFQFLEDQLKDCPTFDEALIEETKTELCKVKEILEIGATTLLEFKDVKRTWEEIDALPEGNLEEWQNKYDALKQESEVLMSKSTTLGEQIGQVTAELKNRASLQKEVDVLKEKVGNKDTIEKQLREYTALIKAYGPKGLKVAQLKSLCHDINRVLPRYTSLIFNGKERFRLAANEETGDVDFEFSEDLQNYADVKFMSGGQKKRLSMCMVFVLADLAVPSKKSNIIILDEVDGPVDDIGKYTLANEFLPYLRDKYESVFVISHSSSLNGIVCDNRWVYSKDTEGKTQISQT